MSTFLVTGGAGFIGSHLADALVLQGHTVIVVDDFNDFYSPAQKEQNVKIHSENPSYILYRADISDFESLKKIFEKHKFDAVYHIGARAGVRRSWNEVGAYTRSNVLGTFNVFELSKQFAVPYVLYASSSTVYGQGAQVPFREDVPLDLCPPASPYGATKRAQESIAAMYAELFGVHSVGLRLFSVYGERIRHDLAPWIFTNAVFKDEPLNVFGSTSIKRDFTYVGDVVSAFLAALELVPKIKHEVFNIGNDNPVEIRRLIDIIENNVGRIANIVISDHHASDPKETWADLSRARRILGFNPQTSLEEGVGKLVEWYKSQFKNQKSNIKIY